MAITLAPGQSAQLQRVRQEDMRVQLSVTGEKPLRLLGILLDEEGKPAGPAPLLTWRTSGNDLQIALADNTIKAILHTAALQEPIQSIMFVVAPYGRKSFSLNERINTEVIREEADPIAFELTASEGGMGTLALCDFYRHPEAGAKVRMRAEWRHRELTLLLERLGIPTEVLKDQMLYPLPDTQPVGDKYAVLNELVQGQAPTEPKPNEQDLNPPPAPEEKQAEEKPPADDIIRLNQAGAQHRISNANGKFGAVRVHFVWHQRLATRAAVKMDVGCFWEMQDGKKGQLEGLSGQHGSLSTPPFIALTGEMHREGAKCYETIAVNGDRWGEMRRVLFYGIIQEGPLQWGPLDARVILRVPDQPPVQAELIPAQNAGPLAALMLLENRGDQIQATYPGGYFESHYALDAAFDFKLRWRKEAERPRDAASETEWVPAAPMGFWRKWLGILFGTATYNEAEDLMRAALAAGAMVMVADGRVNQDDRKQVVDAVMALPVGNMFAEYEAREGLEKILRDLKDSRPAAEKLAVQLISAYRGHGEARMIVQAMRAAAMVDGQVNIQEERMVERLTKYLKVG